jgi:hypothetical protein
MVTGVTVTRNVPLNSSHRQLSSLVLHFNWQQSGAGDESQDHTDVISCPRSEHLKVMSRPGRASASGLAEVVVGREGNSSSSKASSTVQLESGCSTRSMHDNTGS